MNTVTSQQGLLSSKERRAARFLALKKRRPGLAQWIEVFPYLLPTILGFLFVYIGPVIASFILSFTSWDLVRPPEWIGIGNYQRMLGSPLFLRVMKNTFHFVLLYLPPSVILPLLLAVLLNNKLRGVNLIRSAIFLPAVVSTVAVGIVWQWLYNQEFGILNYFLKTIGVAGPAWLNHPRWAMWSIVIMSVWKVLGYNMVIYLAGLQNIPQDYYDSARIDGASAWKELIHITVPLVSPSTFFVLTISLINSFQIFEQTFMLTQGGPAYGTLTLSFYIYQQAFQFSRMGYGAALAYVMFVILLAFTIVGLQYQKKWVHYY